MRELGLVRSGKISSIRKVDENDYFIYAENIKRLTSFSRDYELFRLVSDSYDEFFESLHEYSRAVLGDSNVLTQDHMGFLGFKANRHLLSYLGAVRTFLDHAQTKCSRASKDGIEQLSFYKKVTGDQYDSRFSYRFFYKLRNYAQHCGMPPISFNVDHKPGQSLEVDLRLRKDVLLADYNEWGAKIKGDIQALDDDPSLIGLIDDHFESVTTIYLSLYSRLTRKSVLESKEWICEFLDDKNPASEYCFVTHAETNNQSSSLNLTLQWIPTSYIREVVQVEDRISTLGFEPGY